MSEPSVKIVIAGKPWSHWTRLEITRALEELVPTAVMETFDLRDDPDQLFPFVEGDTITIDVSVNGTFERILTGYIERPEISDGPEDSDQRVSVTAVGKTADLVQCHAAPREWRGVAVLKIAREICEPFGIEVTSAQVENEPVKRFEVDVGQTAASSVQRLCELRGLLATCTEKGDVELTRASTEPDPNGLRSPGGIIRGTFVGDYSERFSSYTVYSQKTPSKRFARDLAAGMVVQVTDSQVRRFRPFYDVSDRDEDKPGMEARAKHIRNVRAARSASYSCDVDGWGVAGRVWRTNTLLMVDHKRVGVNDRLLLSRVVLMGDAQQGYTTNLSFMRPEAYDVIAQPEGRGRGRRSKF